MGRTRKGKSLEFLHGSCECAAQVIFGMRMPARKTRAAVTQDGGDLPNGCAVAKQLLGDPLIGNAPVRMRKALQDVQAAQTVGIDLGGRRFDVRMRRCQPTGRRGRARLVADRMRGLLQQRSSLRSQSRLGIQNFDPGRVPAPVAPLRFLIGEARQAAQMAPIGAGEVAAVEKRQLFSGRAGQRRFDGCGTDLHPSLEIAGAGLEDHTGLVPIAAHGFDDARTGMIQIDQDIAGVLPIYVRMAVDVTAIAVADTQESNCCGMHELAAGPQPFTGKGSLGCAVNQTNQIQIVRHGRDLTAECLPGKMESTVEHGLDFGVKGTRRTIEFQRTADSRLTGCLSVGVHRKD